MIFSFNILPVNCVHMGGRRKVFNSDCLSLVLKLRETGKCRKRGSVVGNAMSEVLMFNVSLVENGNGFKKKKRGGGNLEILEFSKRK